MKAEGGQGFFRGLFRRGRGKETTDLGEVPAAARRKIRFWKAMFPHGVLMEKTRPGLEADVRVIRYGPGEEDRPFAVPASAALIALAAEGAPVSAEPDCFLNEGGETCRYWRLGPPPA